MNRRFDLKGWGPILAAALLGFVLGTTGVSVLWPSMWEGARLSDTLGLWGGILGGFMTLIAAIIAFRPARDQMLIARAAGNAMDLRDLRELTITIAALTSIIEEHMIIVEGDLAFEVEFNYLVNVYDDILNTRMQLIFKNTVEIKRCIITFRAAALKFSHEGAFLEDVELLYNSIQNFVIINRMIKDVKNRGDYSKFVSLIKEEFQKIEQPIENTNKKCGEITNKYAHRARDIELQLGPH